MPWELAGVPIQQVRDLLMTRSVESEIEARNMPKLEEDGKSSGGVSERALMLSQTRPFKPPGE
jgi:hypothetical protein